jgi:ectoine hydroxylase-related dioxygenase (phytanoyl-CoA dioxygenase family)
MPTFPELLPGEQAQLDAEGFLVLEDFVSPEDLEALRDRIHRLFEELGERAGFEFKQEPQTDRLANLIDYDEIFQRAVALPKLLACVAHVLGPDFKLSSLNARSARPHTDWTQPLHCDTGALPDARGNTVCNIIWMLDDFTPDNGASRRAAGHRPARHGGGHERASLAWRHGQSHRSAAAGDAQLLLSS